MECAGHPRWPGPKGAPGPTGPRAVELLPPDPPEPEPEPEPELASEPDDDAVDPALDPVVLAAPDDELELDVGEAAVLTGTRVGAERALRRWELPARCAFRRPPRVRVRWTGANRLGMRMRPVARSPRSGFATARWSRPSERDGVPVPTMAATSTVSNAIRAPAASKGPRILRRTDSTARVPLATGRSAHRRHRALRGRRRRVAGRACRPAAG